MKKFLGRHITNESQWKAYKELELIPDSVPILKPTDSALRLV